MSRGFFVSLTLASAMLVGLLTNGIFAGSAPNDRPIIGILTQPSSSSIQQFGPSYIAASYVKYVEGGGARAVPIFYNGSKEYLKETFNSVNGILFPGGSSSLDKTPLFYAGQYLYELSVEAAKSSNETDNIVPIFGHCMGFELLVTITSNNHSILTPIDAENMSLPLDFTPAAANSRLFGKAPSPILSIMANQNVTMNNHQWCLSPQSYEASANLKSFYSVLSTDFDPEGTEFISTIEANDAPIFGIQWHAEKPEYEWNPAEGINHSKDAVTAMQYMADFFVNEARKNTHSYPTIKDEKNALIYNYDPVFTEMYDPSFEQCYFF